MRGLAAATVLSACVAAPAVAQSSLSISGMVDIGVYRDTQKTWNVGSIQRSNLAFSGTEDLGGGLAATFMFNQRFEPDTGQLEQSNKPFFHGESTVGLRGNFGAVRLGRALDAISAWDYLFDPWGNYDRIASPAWDLWHTQYPSDPLANNGTPEYGRINNAVFFDSPQFHGLSLHLVTAMREQKELQPEQPWSASLVWQKGLFAAALAHGNNSSGDTDTFAGLRGGIGDFSLMGAWDRSKSGLTEAVAYSVGAVYQIGPTALRAGWGRLEVNDARRQDTLGLGADYAFSKRTRVYVDYAHKRYVDDSADTYGVGMAHSF